MLDDHYLDLCKVNAENSEYELGFYSFLSLILVICVSAAVFYTFH